MRRGGMTRVKLALLTEREHDTAWHVAEGLSAPVVAARLGINQRTIEAHRLNLFRKLEIRSSAELAAYSSSPNCAGNDRRSVRRPLPAVSPACGTKPLQSPSPTP